MAISKPEIAWFTGLILPILLLFWLPALAWLILCLLAYVKWKKYRTPAWIATFIAAAVSAAILLGITVFSTYHTIKGLSDPMFFVPLILILIWGLPLATGVLIGGWSLLILFFVIKARMKRQEHDVKKWQLITAIAILTIAAIGLSLYLMRSNTLAKAESPDTPPEVLEELSMHSSLDVRRAVARNPSTPPEILYKLYEERLETGHRAHIADLADNSKTPPDILRKIYDDPKRLSYITYNIAQNPNTPEDILRELASKPASEQVYFIMGLARNPNLPEDLVVRLKKNSSEQVRQAVEETQRAKIED